METADTPAVGRSESDEWDSENELSDLDPWLSDSEPDYDPADDPQYAAIMESWDLWHSPCMCGSKRPGRGFTSARCINDDVDECSKTKTTLRKLNHYSKRFILKLNIM